MVRSRKPKSGGKGKEDSKMKDPAVEAEEKLIAQLNAELQEMATVADKKLAELNGLRRQCPEMLAEEIAYKKKEQLKQHLHCEVDVSRSDTVDVQQVKGAIEKEVDEQRNLDEENRQLLERIKQLEAQVAEEEKLGALLGKLAMGKTTAPNLLKPRANAV